MPQINDWVTAFAAEVGVAPPSQETIDEVLELASVAAHASERWVAPITCWLAATAGVAPSDAIERAQRIATE
jgi:hypothetical protein